ncbi:DUF1232 domain-containing protein [Micromonospora rifamycinica]|uniref:YkvA family protein n=1 Tax=Micromonospora rifamycinica TaxID=291594 RepID=UPI003413293A
MTWKVVLGIGLALATSWVALTIGLLPVRPRGSLLAEAIRILPDLLRTLRRLAADPDLPTGVRVRLSLLIAYLASPVDLIPDVIPLLGYADDAIVVVAVLRSVVRRAGIDAVHRHWPGSPDGFAAVCRLAGIHRTPPP